MPESDPQLYARSFADVYQRWYDDLDDPGVMVRAFRARCAAGARVIELGSGTGRLAKPLHDSGFRVVGLDASAPMLRLAEGGPVSVAGDMAAIPLADASADAALIAYNTFFNLDSEDQQRRCLAEIARVLRPRGVLAVEAFIADRRGSTFGVTCRTHPAHPDERMAIITGPDAQHREVIVGSHIEFGPPVVCRPWRLLYQSPEELDAGARSVGLRRVERYGDWAGTPFEGSADRHVSWYQRA